MSVPAAGRAAKASVVLRIRRNFGKDGIHAILYLLFSYVFRFRNIMWAGMMAHNNSCGVGRSQDWTSHDIEHELSALYDCAHGAGLAAHHYGRETTKGERTRITDKRNIPGLPGMFLVSQGRVILFHTGTRHFASEGTAEGGFSLKLVRVMQAMSRWRSSRTTTWVTMEFFPFLMREASAISRVPLTPFR